MEDYIFHACCQTPEELLDELTSNYAEYLEWLVCEDKDDSTKEEAAAIREKIDEIRAKCLDGQN